MACQQDINCQSQRIRRRIQEEASEKIREEEEEVSWWNLDLTNHEKMRAPVWNTPLLKMPEEPVEE
jgi:hypothetical protein